MTEPIVPVLGAPDGDRVITMASSVRMAVGAASTSWNAFHDKTDPDYPCKTGVFLDQRANQIVDELLANIDAYVNDRIREHNAEQAAKAGDLATDLQRQIDDLAHILIDEFGGPTEADVQGGAVGMAIRVLRDQRSALGEIRGDIGRARNLLGRHDAEVASWKSPVIVDA